MSKSIGGRNKKKVQAVSVKGAKKHTVIKFNIGKANIGAIDALHDSFLEECFIPISAYEGLMSNGMKSILVGRTGTGKTAYMRHLKMLEESESESESFKCVEINVGVEFIDRLKDLSDLIRAQGDQNLTLIFKGLWMHIITVHLIRNLFPSKNVFQQKFSDFLSKNESKKQLEEYVKSRENAVWGNSANIAEIVREVTGNLELKFGVAGVIEGGAKVSGTKASKEIGDKSSEVDYLAEISSLIDMPGLEKAIENLYAYLEGKNVNYYVLIDELDDKWADDIIRYRLIRALIETVHHFYGAVRKANTWGDKYPIKVVMALRQDLQEAVYEQTRDVGFQSEKYKAFESHIVWSRKDLRCLVDKRIQYLCEHKYTSKKVNFQGIFPNKIEGQNTLNYILDRTLLRPRDVIEFVSQCLGVLSEKGKDKKGQDKLSEAMVKEAESEYSIKMHESIIDEWQSVYPQLKIYTKILSKFPKGKFTFEEFGKEVHDFLSETICEEGVLSKWLDDYSDKPRSVEIGFLEILHKVSMVQVKVRHGSPYSDYSRLKRVEGQYKKETKIQIHPMVQSYYGVDAREGE